MRAGALPRRSGAPPWLLALLAFLYVYPVNQYPHWKDTNPCSRVYQTLAMADDGTFAIDGCLARYGDTEDKAEHDGRHYSDKPAGVAFWLYPFAKLLRVFVPQDDFDTMYLWLRILGISVPSVLFWWGTWPRWAEWAGSAGRGSAIVLAGALGTGWWAYSTAAYAHVPAGILLFLAFLALRKERVPLAGFLAGAAFLCDFVVVLGVAVLGLAALRRAPRRAMLLVTGLVPPLLIWMAYNAACFGGPFEVGFLAHADPRYAAAYGRGLLGMQVPEAGALLGLLFSPARGLFFFSPFLLLGSFGWWKDRKADWVCGAVCLAILLFALTTVDWRAGWAYGPRYLVPMIPFLLVGVAVAIRDLAPDHPLAVFFSAGSAVGILWSAVAMLTTPLLVQEFWNPLVSFAGATLVEGSVSPTLLTATLGAWSALPLALAGLAAIWVVGRPWPRPGAVLLLAAALLAGQALVREPARRRAAQEIQRAELLIRMGYPDAARARLAKLEGTR